MLRGHAESPGESGDDHHREQRVSKFWQGVERIRSDLQNTPVSARMYRTMILKVART
jgi:hypothetical protein